MVPRWTDNCSRGTDSTGRSRRRPLTLGSRLISAGGQSQGEGLERHRPLLLLLPTRRPTFSLEVGWLKGRPVRAWAGCLRVAAVGVVSSRALATDRDWRFELPVVVGRRITQLHFHFHLPSALLRAKVCRPLSLSNPYHPCCSCALCPSFFACHAADPRCDLSPPADSTTPALPAAACDLQLARDLQLRPPLTQVDRGNPA